MGTNQSIKTLYGNVDVRIDRGIQHGEKKKLNNYGAPKLAPNQSQKGNHYIVFKIAIPNKLTPEQTKLFEELKNCEEPVEQRVSPSYNDGSSSGSDKNSTAEEEAEKDSIFSKIKNAWSMILI